MTTTSIQQTPINQPNTSKMNNPGDGGYSLILMVTIVFAVSYFFMLRPKIKKEKEQKSMLDKLAVGDEVITYAGIIGKIYKIDKQYILLTVAPNTQITIQKNYIVNILPKGTVKQ